MRLEPDSIINFFLELHRISYNGFFVKNVCPHCNVSLSSGQVKASGKDLSGIVWCHWKWCSTSQVKLFRTEGVSRVVGHGFLGLVTSLEEATKGGTVTQNV